MKSTSRRLIPIIGLMALFLGTLPLVTPAIAHSDALSTSTTCQPTIGCDLGTTTLVTDTITFCLSTDSGTACSNTPALANICADGTTGTDLGTLCIKVYQAGTPTIDHPCVATGLALASSTINLKGGDKAGGDGDIDPVTGPGNDNQVNTFTTSVTTASLGAAGNYVWIVQYSGVTGITRDGHDLLKLQTCEPFTLTGHFPPPPGVPEFPLGMVLLMAVAIPALFLVRSRFPKIASTQIT